MAHPHLCQPLSESAPPSCPQPHPAVLFSTEEKEALLNSAASPPVPAREDYAELHSAIARLPEKLRVAVILFYFRDMDIHSAASILGVAPGTMKSRLNRARARLKEALPDETDLSL